MPPSDDELAAIRDLVDEFGRKEIRPHVRHLEELGEFPRHLYLPGDALREAVSVLAETIATHSRAALVSIKDAVRFGLDNPEQSSAERELEGLLWLLAARSEGAS